MRKTKKLITLLLIVPLLIVNIPIHTYADSSVRFNVPVILNGDEVGSIAALDVNYDDNMYVSLRGIANILNRTDKSINVSISDDEINLYPGQNYDGTSNKWSDEECLDRPKWKLKRTSFYINGNEKKYYSLTGHVGDSGTDAFLSPLRIAIMLDIDIDIKDGSIIINTDKGFGISDVALENSGYLQGINSLLIGDGTSLEIYFDHDGEEVVPIASTTKLMTYFVMMDAVKRGDISLSDNVPISKNAISLSEGIDGLVDFNGISSVPLSELTYAMLLPSCNECALAIAEYVAGSEEAFVELMNEKAKELELEKAEFYNSNGLPVYEETLLPAKIQNHMTAKDMFKLASELVKVHPEVMDITSVKVMELPTLRYTAKNTNALLYNMESVKGLKTGTTNKSGACLVTVLPAEKDGDIHNLICVLFGAEGEFDRALVAELANKIALTKLSGAKETVEEKFTITPDNPEIDVERMLRNLR